MSLTDKEIALELTKAYLEHLSHRAQSNNVSKSHATTQSIVHNYETFYSTVHNLKD
ncbi:TPA: hypothetical protein U4681_001757 [Streptococcus agalactiae]|nr:hypothetical protein [Streptococcus agalactiae]HEN3163638.1 hypothetical protein [Streptococcus agalactiae]HEN3176163.1 hypothetical protein [Streptococcus agalactiae]HEN3188986.1 hypothetical protein [Streptococcus agalactiae]HEO4501087.1 hypothetical protein [Streptococcus agalactiae]